MAVLGIILMGIATVTEATTPSVFVVILSAWGNLSLVWWTLLGCLSALVKTISKIILIVMGASFFSRSIRNLSIPRYYTQYLF